MRERPIIFSGPMVRAILAGTKTQTRRVWKMPHGCGWYEELGGEREGWFVDHGQPWWLHVTECRCRQYGSVGDRLWIRESFIHEPADYCWEASVSIPCQPATTVYRADADDPRGGPWKSPIHMPRSLSRITLEITDVRVERLQDISEADAVAEGAPSADLASGRECIFPHQGTYRWGFRLLWEQINGPGSWDANPWVWALSFRRVAEMVEQR